MLKFTITFEGEGTIDDPVIGTMEGTGDLADADGTIPEPEVESFPNLTAGFAGLHGWLGEVLSVGVRGRDLVKTP